MSSYCAMSTTVCHAVYVLVLNVCYLLYVICVYVFLVLLTTLLTAGTRPIPIIEKSSPHWAQDTMHAKGGEKFKLLSISFEMSTTAPLSFISEERRDEMISIIQGNVHVNTVFPLTNKHNICAI